MLYIEKKIDAEFLQTMLNILLALHGQKIVFWKYQNTKYKLSKIFWNEIKPYYVGKNELETVTQYNDSYKTSPMVDYYKFNQDIVTPLVKHFNILAETLDSISIYKDADDKWLGCLIFHEQMTLLRVPSAKVDLLKNHNIKCSDKPPDWW